MAAARPNSPRLPYVDLACAAAAGALWYAFPRAGPWPLLVALPPWVARLATERRLTRRTKFDLPLLLFLVTAGLAVWTAYDRTAAWSKFWLIVGGILLFYALANAEAIARHRPWLLALFGAGVALYFLATHDWGARPAKIVALTRLGQVLQTQLPPLPGHRLHPNVAGGILAMMVPFAGLVTLRAWRGREPGAGRRTGAVFLAFGLLLVTCFGLLMTTSRGAWIGLGTALALVALWHMARALARGARRLQTRWFAGLGGGLLLLAALAVALIWDARPDWPSTPVPAGPAAAVAPDGAFPAPLPPPALLAVDAAGPRLDLLRNTLVLVKDYALLGAGLGGFMMLYSTYSVMLHVGYSIHSHNLFLDLAVEQGVAAALLVAGMGLVLILAWWRSMLAGGRRVDPAAIRSREQASAEALAAACLSLVVVFVHGQLDDALYGSRAVLLLFLPLAFAGTRGTWTESGTQVPAAPGGWAAWAAPGATLGLLVLALIARRPILSRLAANLGAVGQSRTELSVYRWPEWPLQDTLRRSDEVDLSRPMAQFERALTLDPGNATANRRLGMIELSRGHYPSALGHLERAYAREPWSQATRQLLGEAYLANGRLAEGQALWAGVNNERNQLSLRVWWYGSIGDEERAAWMAAAIP